MGEIKTGQRYIHNLLGENFTVISVCYRIQIKYDKKPTDFEGYISSMPVQVFIDCLSCNRYTLLVL